MTIRVLFWLGISFSTIPVAAATFHGIGFLPGVNWYSEASAVSADGRVVVGEGRPGEAGEDAIRWTSVDGIEYIGDLPGGLTRSLSTDVSADGSVIVGRGFSSGGAEAFRWTRESGMQGLGRLRVREKIT